MRSFKPLCNTLRAKSSGFNSDSAALKFNSYSLSTPNFSSLVAFAEELIKRKDGASGAK